MTIHKLGSVQFPTYRVVVSQDSLTDRIYCFKHTPTRCELESFDSKGLAAEYVITPLSSIEYHLVIDGETPE